MRFLWWPFRRIVDCAETAEHAAPAMVHDKRLLALGIPLLLVAETSSGLLGHLLGIKIFSAQSERPVFGRGTFSLKPFL